MSKYLPVALFVLALTFIACSGGSDNPAPNPTPQPIISIGINPSTATIKPTKSVELTVTAHNTEIIFPHSLQVLGTFTVTNNKVTWTPPQMAGVYEFTVTATVDASKKATAKVTVDDSRTQGYLIESLAEVCKDIANKEVPETQWPHYGQLIKEAFVHGWEYDSYAVNIPFTSEEMQKGLQHIEFSFAYQGNSFASSRRATIGTQTNIDYLKYVVVHEIGHCMGLNEQLTELMSYKFTGWDLGLFGSYGKSANFFYNPTFYNMLLEKVGDTNFWNTVFRSDSRNQALGELWDSQIAINHSAFILLLPISAEINNGGRFLMDTFLPFSEFWTVNELNIELAKLPTLFSEALNGNTESQSNLDVIFNMIESYFEIYPNTWIFTAVGAKPIFEDSMKIFIQDTLNSASQSMPNAA